jgi:hypothetical protein
MRVAGHLRRPVSHSSSNRNAQVCVCARLVRACNSTCGRICSQPPHLRVCDRGGTSLLPTATHEEFNDYSSPSAPAPAALESEVEALARQLAELDSLSALASPATKMAPLPDHGGDVVEKVVQSLLRRLPFTTSAKHSLSFWGLLDFWTCGNPRLRSLALMICNGGRKWRPRWMTCSGSLHYLTLSPPPKLSSNAQ